MRTADGYKTPGSSISGITFGLIIQISFFLFPERCQRTGYSPINISCWVTPTRRNNRKFIVGLREMTIGPLWGSAQQWENQESNYFAVGVIPKKKGSSGVKNPFNFKIYVSLKIKIEDVLPNLRLKQRLRRSHQRQFVHKMSGLQEHHQP